MRSTVGRGSRQRPIRDLRRPAPLTFGRPWTSADLLVGQGPTMAGDAGREHTDAQPGKKRSSKYPPDGGAG